MTIIAHKFLSALLQKPDAEMGLNLLQDETPEETKLNLEALIEGIEQAEKFDFGQLHLEEGAPGEYALPDITDDELTAWKEGLIPLPADICWYEFIIGSIRSGMLVVQSHEGNTWSVQRLDWVPGRKLVVDGIWCSATRKEQTKNNLYVLTLHGNKPIRNCFSDEDQRSLYGTAMPLALYLTLMINSRTTEITREAAPVKLNKIRAKQGRLPLPDHRIVRIVPERYLRERRKESGLTRLPPRLHWRRSHVRVLHRGTAKERRILIPRFLVSRASEAEVTHEYRIG